MTTSSPQPSLPVSVSEAEGSEDRFFKALLTSDTELLEALLTDDFVIVDVLSGTMADRAAFTAAFRERALAFERIDVVERTSQPHGDTVIIVGRSAMAGSFNGNRFAAASRYTHVLIRQGDGHWRLASAQGTPIADA